MNDMNNYRDYRDESYRDYRDYREDYRDYREDYRNNRDYDMRGGRINNRNYRNYREESYDKELHMCIEDMREQYRRLEDVAEMAENPQEKNMLMRIAQKSKENYMNIKQMMEK